MPTRINYGQFGVEFVRQALAPPIVQAQLNRMLPQAMGTITEYVPINQAAGVDVTAKIVNVSVGGSSQQIGLLNVLIQLSIDVRGKYIIEERYKVDAYVPFVMVVQTYAPLIILFNYQPVVPQNVRVNVVCLKGPGLATKKLEEELPQKLANKVNEGLASHQRERTIDILDRINRSMARSSLALKQRAKDGMFDAQGKLLFAKRSTPARSAGRRPQVTPLNYQQFGEQFIRLVLTPERVQGELRKSVAADSQIFDFSLMLGGVVKTVQNGKISPPTVTSPGLGYLDVTMPLKMQMDLYLSGGGHEGWLIEASLPFRLEIQAYLEGLGLYMAALPINPEAFRINAYPTTATSFSGVVLIGELKKAFKAKLEDSLRAANEARTIRILQKLQQALSSPMKAVFKKVDPEAFAARKLQLADKGPGTKAPRAAAKKPSRKKKAAPSRRPRRASS